MTTSAREPRALFRPIPVAEELPDRADVVVVGGGIAGASTLHHLIEAGIDAVLVERDRVGSGATAAAVGVLSPPLRQPYQETVRHRGADQAGAVWSLALRSVKALGDRLEALGRGDEAELDRAGGYMLAEPHTVAEVEGSYRALAEAGFPVRWLDAAEVRESTRGRGFAGAYLLEGGGALSPAGATRALVRAIAERGVAVVEGVSIDRVEREGGALTCHAGERILRCDMVVYATHVDSRRFSALLGDEIVPIRGQALAARVRRGRLPDGAFSTHWKLNVWRKGPEDRLHLGGWRHDAWDRSYWKTQPAVDTRLQEDLLGWFRQAFPEIEIEVTRQWSGIFGWTADYLPLVGPLPGATDELVVSGFSGGGLPFAWECGRIVADIVAGRDPGPEAALFQPRRFVT